MPARQAGWSELNAKRKREAEANRLRLYRGETPPTTTTPVVIPPGDRARLQRSLSEDSGQWATDAAVEDAWRLEQGTQAPTTTAPIAVPQRGLITPDISEMQGIPEGLIPTQSQNWEAAVADQIRGQVRTGDEEVNDIAKWMEKEENSGELTSFNIAKRVSDSSDADADKTPNEVLAQLDWSASDAGLESTEARRKRYMKDMNDIFTKSMMLKVLSNLSGSDGGDMSKMFMQFAFEKMDKRKEFAGEDRLKKIRDKVYYRRNAAGEMIFDAPKFRSEGYERVLAVGGDAKDAKGMFGHLPQEKQPSTTKANYRVWHRIVDGKLQQDSFRGDELPDRGEHQNIPWLAMSYTPPSKRAGTEYMQFLAKASERLRAGDRDGAEKQMRIFFRGEQRWLEKQVTPERLEELVQETMADLGSGSGGASSAGMQTSVEQAIATPEGARIKADVIANNPGKSDVFLLSALEARLRREGLIQ